MHGLMARTTPPGGIDPNETFVAVYYLYVGDLSKFPKVAETYGDKARSFFPTARTPAEIGLVPIFSDGKAPSRFWRGDDVNRPSTANARQFWLYERFMPGAMPVFLVQSAEKGEYRITHDPYVFGTNVVANATKLNYFLGWSLPGKDATDAAGSCSAQVMTLNSANVPGSIAVDNSYYKLEKGFKFVTKTCAKDTAGRDF